MSLPVQADVGHRFQPLSSGGINRREGRDLQAIEKIFLHITDAVFDASFGLDCELHPIPTSAGNNFE